MLIRRPLSRPRRWLILVLLFATLVLPSGAAARPSRQVFNICGSPTGDAWFVEELAFAPLRIAPGVLVEPLDRGDPDGAESFARLSNSTDTPLYLIEDAYPETWHWYGPAAPISLTAPLIARTRVVSGQVAFWADQGGGAFAWRDTPRSDGVINVSRTNPGWSLSGYRSLQRYEDDRPAGVALPSAVYQLRVIYGDEWLAIPVTLSTRLNPDYNPNKQREEQARCDSWGEALVSKPMALVSLAGDLVRWCLMLPLLIGIGLIVVVLPVMMVRLWQARA